MPQSLVADAGGLLVLAGVLEGTRHQTDEILALDATALLVAEYLAVRHEGVPDRARADFLGVTEVVREWFPVRGVAVEAALAAGSSGDADACAALALAESLRLPLVTKHAHLRSTRVEVLRC